MNNLLRAMLLLLCFSSSAFWLPSSASASQIPASTYPDFTEDGTGHGYDTHDLIYSYYGGIAFTPESDFQANSFEISACSNATTSLPVQVFFEISDISALSTTTGERASYPTITTVAGNIESCSGGLQHLFVNHNYDFDTTLYSFVTGHKYMIHPVGFGTDFDAVWQNIDYASTFSPADNISACYQNIFCGGFFELTDHDSMWISFANTGQPPVVSSCYFGTFPFFDITQCFTDLMQFLFVPSSSVFDNFSTLKDDIKNKAPFGYFTSATNAITSISGTDTPMFVLATSTPIMNYIFTPIRTGLGWLIYFAGLIWLYKRLTNIII